jgi:regulatory protein
MRPRTGTDRLAAQRARRDRHAAETDQAVVLNAAARVLELRSRSVGEVRWHLRGAAFPEPLVEGAIARLLELGVLDDRAFAQAWVESRDRARPRGEAALRRELALKGIDRETVAAVLAERSEAAGSDDSDADADADADGNGAESGAGRARGADELAAERLLAKSRSTLMRVADLRLRRQRAYGLLARNGFDPEVCRLVSGRLVAVEDTLYD